MPKRGQKTKRKKAVNPKYEAAIKKIKKMYENYGINTADMSEQELDRLYKSYKKLGGDIDKDLKDSERFSSVFEEDII